MMREEFEKIVAEEFPKAVPEKYQKLIRNVGFVIEDEPSLEERQLQKLAENETLLGLYRGVPKTARGESYGVGVTLPDLITLYQLPIEDEARQTEQDVRSVVRETIWHEVAHHFGFDEHEVRARSARRKM